MSQAVEYASRVLSATEDFSVEESKHGQVALESLILRRCLATSLWGASDGVLNQLRGVGAKTSAKLSMNKIRTFADILTKSSNDIEQACGRKSPFGQELKRVVSKIMSKSLKLSAYVEGLESDSKPNELICTLSPREDISVEGTETTPEESRIVTYTLAVHTDRPGGSLMFRTEVNGPGKHQICCPNKFGRIYIRLVSNLVGLDEQLIIEGNDIVEKSSFTLSPQNAKKKTKVTPSKNQKETHLSQSLQTMVSGVKDFRMSKQVSNKTKQANSSRTISTPAPSERNSPMPLATGQVSPMADRAQSLVTPSPSFINRSRIGTISPKVPPKRRLSSTESNGNDQMRRERTIIRDPKRCRTHNSSWQKQKKKQHQFQQRAFGSPKENPFSKFKFDPNNVEKQLEMESQNNYARKNADSTIIPPTTSASSNRTNTLHIERRSRFIASGLGTVKTPSKSLNIKFIGSARRRRVGTPNMSLSQPALLRQKAEEQQAYILYQQQSRPMPNNIIQQHQHVMNPYQPQNMMLPQQNFNNEILQDGFDLQDMQSSFVPSETVQPYHHDISINSWNNVSNVESQYQGINHNHLQGALSATQVGQGSQLESQYFVGPDHFETAGHFDFTSDGCAGNEENVHNTFNSHFPIDERNDFLTQNHAPITADAQPHYDHHNTVAEANINQSVQANIEPTNMEGMVINVAHQIDKTDDAFESAFF